VRRFILHSWSYPLTANETLPCMCCGVPCR